MSLPGHIAKYDGVGAAEEEGVVVDVVGRVARVKVVRGAGCATCAIAEKCPFNAATPRDWQVWAQNEVGARKGDKVKISIAPSRYILISALLFILPVAMLIAGYVLARALGATESSAVGAAVVGAFAAYVIIRAAEKSSLRTTSYRVVEVIESSADDAEEDT